MIIKGVNAGRVFPLSKDETIIGRGMECDIRIPDTMVSRSHCRIKKSNDKFWIKDLHSTNKTFVNEKVISVEKKLQIGDIIKIGNTALIFTDQEDMPVKSVSDYNILRKNQTIEFKIASTDISADMHRTQ